MKALIPALAFALTAPPLCGHEPLGLTGLVRTAHAVLRGRVISRQAVSGGLLSRLTVLDLVWGELPAGEVWIFTLGSAVPDAPQAPLEVDCVLGVCWIDGDEPAWRVRLAGAGKDVAPQGIAVLCADGQLEVAGNEALVVELAEWIRNVREETDTDRFEAAALLLLRHESPGLRKSVLEELAMRHLATKDSVASPGLELSLNQALSHEESTAGDASCLASIHNVMELKSPAVVDRSRADAASLPGSSVALSSGSILSLTVLQTLKAASEPSRARNQEDTGAR